MKEKLNSLSDKVLEILKQIDTAQDLAITIKDSVTFCIENGKNCGHILTIVEYLVKEISNINENTDELHYQIQQTSISLK